MQSDLTNQPTTTEPTDPIADNLKSKLDSYFTSATKETNSLKVQLFQIKQSKDVNHYLSFISSLKQHKTELPELMPLLSQVSIELHKSTELIKALIALNQNELIVSFFSEISKEKEDSYVFYSLDDFETTLFTVGEHVVRYLDTLYVFLNRATEEKINAMYPVFSLALHSFSKNLKIDDASMLLNYLTGHKMEISTCAINNYIDALCKKGQLEAAHKDFQMLCEYKPQLKFKCDNFNFSKFIIGQGVNIVTYGTFIKWLCKTNNLELALYYYNFLKDRKCLKDEIIYNLIIDGCSKMGNIDTIRTIYFEMLNNSIKPTIVTFNTIIDAFIRAKDIDNAWKIFEDLLKNKIQPDNFTLSTLFRGIREPEHRPFLLKAITLVENYSKISNQEADIILINVLLDSCIALREDKLLMKLFNKVISGCFTNVSPDLITYNTFIKGCAQMGLYNEVSRAFEDMCNSKRVLPNDVTFNTLIDVFVRSKNMNKVWFIISKMKEMGIKPDNFTYSTIIKGLNKNTNLNCGNSNSNENELDLAFKLFENVKKNSKPDEILYNCIMDACLRFGKIDKMLELYDTMNYEGIKPSSITCGIVIKAYGMQGELEKALQIYNKMKQENIEISNVTYGCLINACIKNDNLSKAFSLYEELKSNGYEMNTILYTTLIKAYTKTKNLNKVLEIFETMKTNTKNLPNNITYNSVIDCCLKCNDYAKADKFFNEMSNSKTISPDLITFSTLIKGSIRNNNFAKAMEYFTSMLNKKIQPDDVFLNSLLDGCEKLQYYDKAIYIFQTIKKLGVEPTMMSYSIMMKILGKLGNYEYSHNLMKEVKAKNSNFSLIIFTCYIKTCFSTGHIKEACSTFYELKKFHLYPDSIAYNTMISGITNSRSSEDFSQCLLSLVKQSISQEIYLQRHYYISCIKYMRIKKNYSLADELSRYLEQCHLLKPRKDFRNNNSKNDAMSSISGSTKETYTKPQMTNEKVPLNSIWDRNTSLQNSYNDSTGTNYENRKKKGAYKNYNIFSEEQNYQNKTMLMMNANSYYPKQVMNYVPKQSENANSKNFSSINTKFNRY